MGVDDDEGSAIIKLGGHDQRKDIYGLPLEDADYIYGTADGGDDDNGTEKVQFAPP